MGKRHREGLFFPFYFFKMTYYIWMNSNVHLPRRFNLLDLMRRCGESNGLSKEPLSRATIAAGRGDSEATKRPSDGSCTRKQLC
jgi:hypothetical protein